MGRMPRDHHIVSSEQCQVESAKRQKRFLAILRQSCVCVCVCVLVGVCMCVYVGLCVCVCRPMCICVCVGHKRVLDEFHSSQILSLYRFAGTDLGLSEETSDVKKSEETSLFECLIWYICTLQAVLKNVQSKAIRNVDSRIGKLQTKNIHLFVHKLYTMCYFGKHSLL